jgi:hypothetical protein
MTTLSAKPALALLHWSGKIRDATQAHQLPPHRPPAILSHVRHLVKLLVTGLSAYGTTRSAAAQRQRLTQAQTISVPPLTMDPISRSTVHIREVKRRVKAVLVAAAVAVAAVPVLRVLLQVLVAVVVVVLVVVPFLVVKV